MLWVLLIAMIIAANGWLRAGCLVPFRIAQEPEYLLLLPSVSILARWFLAALAVLTLVHLAVARRVFGITNWAESFDWRWVRYLSPIALLTLPLAAAGLLATPLRRAAGPWLFVSVDLFWWLVAAVVVLIGLELGFSPSVRVRSRWGLDVALVVVLAVSSLTASPRLRFQSVLVGDEPKYLRYLESWYRGHGMDVSSVGPIADLPPDAGSRVTGNFVRLAGALSEVSADLAADARRALGMSAPPRPGPATSKGGWFVDGKRGGVYQVHNPGISFLLFPGYVIDRALSHAQFWHPQFPTDLYATGAIVLLLYVLWGVSAFRLTRTVTQRAGVSWIITAMLFLSLPVTALAYQYYPEVAAGLIAALLVRYALRAADGNRAVAAMHGVLAGFLPWLHLRFATLTLGAMVVVALTRRRDRPALAGFAAGLLPLIAALAVYDYHVTGNLMPWALYVLMPGEALFSVGRAWYDFPAMWLDRTWGLVGQAPIYLFALPGLWLTWRKDRFAAIVMILAVSAIAIPAAGHGYTGAFTTPSRLVACILPLLAAPIAEAAITFARSRSFVASFVLLGVVSVQNGLTYNVHLIKSEASLHAAGTGGWLFPLLLPDFETPTRWTQPLAFFWAAIAIGLVVLPLAAERRRASSGSRSWTFAAATTVLVFAAASAVIGAVTGARDRSEFTLNPGDARDRVIHDELTGRPAFRWSSLRGPFDVKAYFPNPPETTATIAVDPETPVAGTPLDVALDVRRPGNRPGWGTAVIDFGDGSPPLQVPIEGGALARHAYGQPGDYTLTVEFRLWGLDSRLQTRPLHVNSK